MAAIGMFLLIASVITALAATAVYPTNPQTVTVGAKYAQPAWVASFPEGYYLSGNMLVVGDPDFSSPSSLQQFSYSLDRSQASFISSSWTNTGPIASDRGSLQISSTSTSPNNITISKTFHYPYRGPPLEFVLSPLTLMAQGVSQSQPVQVRLFLNRAQETSYTLWSTNITQNGQIARLPVLDSKATTHTASS
jgi:hypothetical protein